MQSQLQSPSTKFCGNAAVSGRRSLTDCRGGLHPHGPNGMVPAETVSPQSLNSCSLALHKELSCSWCKAVCRGQARWGRENGKALWGCLEAVRPRVSLQENHGDWWCGRDWGAWWLHTSRDGGPPGAPKGPASLPFPEPLASCSLAEPRPMTVWAAQPPTPDESLSPTNLRPHILCCPVTLQVQSRRENCTCPCPCPSHLSASSQIFRGCSISNPVQLHQIK